MTDDLRRRAEDRARETAAEMPERLRTLSSEESLTLLHDLRVHQIELEMQNEELRRTQEELEASRARYFDLYDLAPVGYFTISDNGLILGANLTAATLFGVARGALAKQPLTRFIVPEDQDRYYLHRRRLFATGAPQVLELRLKRGNAHSSGHGSRRPRRSMVTAEPRCAGPS
jgi:PAS domain S-box-containing protein